MNWKTAVEDARELATGAKNSDRQEHHIPTLIKCVLDLCDAIEEIAQHAGTPVIDHDAEPVHDQAAAMERIKATARERIEPT